MSKMTIKRLAIQDAATPANIAYLNNVSEGVDGASAFGFSQDPVSLLIADKEQVDIKREQSLDIRILNPDDATSAILQAIVDGKPGYLSAYCIDGFLIFNDPVLMTRVNQIQSSSLLIDIIQASITSVLGYGGDAPNTRQAIYGGENALGIYKVREGSSSLLNGMTAEAGVTGVCSGSTQTVLFTTAQDAFLSQPILMPFAGEYLTASLTALNVTGDYRLGLRFLSASQAELSDDYVTFNGTGRQSHAAIIPASTVYVQFYVTNDGALTASEVWNTSTEVWNTTDLWWITGNLDILSFSLPAIRVNGAEYID
jgi:hypothetical protein